MGKKKTDQRDEDPLPWIVLRKGGNQVYCQRCGRSINVTLPMPARIWLVVAKAFIDTHKHCKEQKP